MVTLVTRFIPGSLFHYAKLSPIANFLKYYLFNYKERIEGHNSFLPFLFFLSFQNIFATKWKVMTCSKNKFHNGDRWDINSGWGVGKYGGGGTMERGWGRGGLYKYMQYCAINIDYWRKRQQRNKEKVRENKNRLLSSHLMFLAIFLSRRGCYLVHLVLSLTLWPLRFPFSVITCGLQGI